MARIAIETSKEMDNAKKSYDQVFEKFFSKYLNLRTNEQLEEGTIKLPELNKPYLNNLKRYYSMEADVD